MNSSPPIIRSEARPRVQKDSRNADFQSGASRFLGDLVFSLSSTLLWGRGCSPFPSPRYAGRGDVGLRSRKVEGVALVITLLMLSVITFLAVAFLAMSRQNKSAVSASLDIATARASADAAQARAQTEIIANMMAHGDALAYDYMVSRNFQSASFTNSSAESIYDPNNVNYQFLYNTATRFSSANANGKPWAQNIANLFYDPRPPVFVVTNPAYPNNYDFRFWVDLNRNGEFETNGDQITLIPAQGASYNGPYTSYVVGSNKVLNGEPEWIGQLKNPLWHHSSSNTFIGRYAYLVLPVGKSLDLNYIYNYLKRADGDATSVLNNAINQDDGFARDQGVGSWELNLAATLEYISPWAYERANHGNYPGFPRNIYDNPTAYSYYAPGVRSPANMGNAFDDADAILHFRYGSNV